MKSASKSKKAKSVGTDETALIRKGPETDSGMQERPNTHQACGISDRVLMQALGASLTEAELEHGQDRPDDVVKTALGIRQAIEGIAPQDEIEQLLASQMIAVHTSGMRFLERAGRSQISGKLEEQAVNMAVKLMRTFTAQLEALNRHRGKGQQKVTVEHVTVNQGGQAIVGVVGEKGGAQGEG